MKLLNYFRSSTSFRVRIALKLKGIAYDYLPYHLRHGEQRSDAFLKLNPQGLVPALETDEGLVITQSLAIIDYLDEVYPEPPLLPATAGERARVRSIALAMACDVHPLNNLRVLSYLRDPLGHDAETVAEWFRHWCTVEFDALETRLAREAETGRFCHGDRPSLADICLVPQLVNSRRFDCDLTPYPTLRRIEEACMALEAFAAAAPARQPDAE